MKKFIIKILKIFLLLTLILLTAALVFVVVNKIGGQWWVGLCILVGLLGLWLGIVFLKKIWLRRREQHFVNQVIEQDEFYLKALGNKEKKSSKELQGRWKEAIDTLKKSHLRKYGNPLYVLPWYMVIGESGSGKTTAIKSARLSSPFAEVSRTSGISGTRNCDWWFFEQAILIDTAGRYAIPIDEGRDKEEWKRFLSLLLRYRKKEPLNGLVVTIAADKLAVSSPELLEELGKSIRRRIDELMHVLGTKFPIYVLVTKCDLVKGMTQFCEQISEKAHDQAMGVLRDLSKHKNIDKFTEHTIHSIGERLKDLRLLFFHKPASRSVAPDLLLFPEEFEKLKLGIYAFIRGAFQENPFQETPILRGLFFSSGKQEGSPFSHFLKELGLIGTEEVLPGTDKGLFLHDLFTKILPSDRALFEPTAGGLKWKRLTRNLGLISWIAISIAACGLLTFSYHKNKETLKYVKSDFSKPFVLQGEIIPDTDTMNQFREAITNVEEKNRDWWIPRFGLNQSIDIEKTLKEKYCMQFRNRFLTSFDKQMAKAMQNFSDATSEEVIGRYVDHLVKRINLLQARSEGQGIEWLQTKPQPSFDTIVLKTDQNLMPEVSKKITNLYHYFLIWQQDTDKKSLIQNMNTLQDMLEDILKLKGITLNWLVGWVNSDPYIKPVIASDFWKNILAKEDDVYVPPAFTIPGKKRINAFIDEIESSLTRPWRNQSRQNYIIESKKRDFKNWYTKSYLQAWYDFLTMFPNSRDRLEKQEQWRPAAEVMASDQGPYFAVLERIAQELEPLDLKGMVPEWVKFVYDFKATKMQALATEKEEKFKKAGLYKKATRKVEKTIKKAEKAFGVQADQTMDMESRMLAAKAFVAYQKALNEISTRTTSWKASYDLGSELYNSEDSDTTSKSPFFTAQDEMNKLETALISPQTDLKSIWKLVTEPLDFLHEFVLKESACYLQEQWKKTVLLEIPEAGDTMNINNLLWGKGGLVKEFIKKTANPFIDQNLYKVYFAKQKMGRKVDFEDGFFSYITKDSKAVELQENYSINIHAFPPDVNIDAMIRPHTTKLLLQCATEKPQELIITSFPVSKTFNWSPRTCENIIFKIEVGNKVLTKKYTGDLAFPEFISDFKYGMHKFLPNEFPAEKTWLEWKRIEYIMVKYRFKGHKPVLELLQSHSGKIPQKITRCWD
ncbi:MAG: hypothetical protein OER74_14835 [Desulfobacteraceae bacterium]|nr:hypothetical protein [Desulfobacteraceae bacterium]